MEGHKHLCRRRNYTTQDKRMHTKITAPHAKSWNSINCTENNNKKSLNKTKAHTNSIKIT